MGPGLDGLCLSLSAPLEKEHTVHGPPFVPINGQVYRYSKRFSSVVALSTISRVPKKGSFFVIYYLEHFGDIMVEPNLVVVTLLVEIKILKIN